MADEPEQPSEPDEQPKPGPDAAGQGEPPPDAPPGAGAPAPDAAATGTARPGDDEGPEDASRLPVEEVVRRLQAQMADPDWRATRWHLVLGPTIDEDPAGAGYLELAFPWVRRPRATERAWRRAQEVVDASPLGRALGLRVALLPGGGRFHGWLDVPGRGAGYLVAERGYRAPLGALRHIEREYLRDVIDAGVRVLAARERWAAEHADGGAPPTLASTVEADEPDAPPADGSAEGPA